MTATGDSVAQGAGAVLAKARSLARSIAAALVIGSFSSEGALVQAAKLLPVSNGELKLGEWNSNFSGARSVADAHGVPLLVFFGGLSCGRCESLQRACLTDEFLAWQASHKMLMVYVTNNLRGNASGFAKPQDSTGYPFIAVYWNRYGTPPQKGDNLYKAFNGRNGEMLAGGETLTEQLIGSIESVVGEYDFSSLPDISERANLLYSEPVTTRLFYDVSLFTGMDAAQALEPQVVYNLKGLEKATLKKVSGDLPPGVKLVCKDGKVVLSGAAKKAMTCSYAFSLQQKRNGIVHVGPTITVNFNVVAANDESQGGCAMLGRALKATVPLFSDDGDEKAMTGILTIVVAPKGTVKAQFSGINRSKATFRGAWSKIADGAASAALVSLKGDVLRLTLAGDGTLDAYLPALAGGTSLRSLVGLRVGSGAFAQVFAGRYTVAMVERSALSGTGSGHIIVKSVSDAGRAKWSGVLGNGRNVSGNAFCMVDASGYGILTVFKCSSREYVAAVLKIQPSAQSVGSLKAVASCDGTVASWGNLSPTLVHDCDAVGSRYMGTPVDDACLNSIARLAFEPVSDGFVSGKYGALVSAPTGVVSVASGRFDLVSAVPGLKLKYVAATGEFKGTMRLQFGSSAVSAKFSGVAIPGWQECSANEPSLADPQPFAIGAAWFPDVDDGGVSAARGFTVRICGGVK